jgi:ABC-type uncharacterized transport system YnjBCD ATPase subunit
MLFARGAAHGALDVGVSEGDAAAGEAVDVGGDDVFKTQTGQGVPALLVGHDEDDVGLVGHGVPYLAVNTDSYGAC